MSEDIKKIINNLKVSYHSGHGDKLDKEFYNPLLAKCNLYKRETGDFTSNVIFEWGEALLNVIDKPEGECVVKIIAAPNLREEDKNLLLDVMSNKQDEKYIEKITDNIFHEAFNLSTGNAENEIKLKIFAYLIIKKILILKFGFPKHIPRPGVFHPKAGVFYFDESLKVGFSGGANETHGGYVGNIERIDVYKNINHEDLHLNDIEEKFDLGWDGLAPGYITKKLNKKILSEISSYAPKSKNELKEQIAKFNKENKKTLGESISEDNKKKLESLIQTNTSNSNIDKLLEENKKFNLWSHQKEAVDKFLLVKAGILEMATGTGKTKTSLEILKRLLEGNKVNSCIITTNGNDLLGQWYIELLNFHSEIKNKIKKFFRYYGDNNTSNQFIDNPENSLLIISRDNLQKILKFLDNSHKKNILIIHDEVHGFGSPSNISRLEGSHKDFIYRLGMSATPEREYGEEGNNFITNEIGSVFYKYRLEDAIKDNVLCKMNYITQNYYLSDEERSEIKKIIASHHAKKKSGENVKDADLFTKIAAIRKNAESKISIFADFIKKNPEIIKNTIIFVYSKSRGRQISEILQGKVKYREYFDNDVSEHLDYFAKGDLDCLITCHRLSQGIDIKGLKNVILIASDRSRLESIQRIGRCLRKNPKDPEKIAVVLDLIDKDYEADIEREKWLNSIASIK